MADTEINPAAQIPLTIAANAVGDQPTDEDSLGFGPYVEAITAFLTSDATQPPLTMSIEGEWGSGKSSFMLQLEKAIRGPSRTDVFMQKLPQRMGGMGPPGSLTDAFRSALKQRQQITIQFNAWRHDKQDALWAAFALKFAKSLRKQVGHMRGWKGDVSLFLRRLKGLRGWTELALLVLSLLLLALGAAGFYRFVRTHQLAELRQVISRLATTESHTPSQLRDNQSNQAVKTDDKSDPKQLSEPYEILLSHGKWGASLGLALLGFIKFHRQLKIPLSINLKKYLLKPDYQGHTAFIESFHEDFARMVKAYAKERRIFVFIDDLDRADVPRAAELMQAINLMIGDAGKLVFILGMDREKVAAGIAQKYKDLLPFIPGFSSFASGPSSQPGGLYFGYSYLEKFIQLSFTLPVLSDPDLLMRFLSSISHNAASSSWFSRLVSFRSSQAKASVKQKSAMPGPLEGVAVGTGAEAIAQEERVEYLRIRVEKDSDQILTIAAMVSAIFENNPRRLKQFINTFRLSLFLASSQGLLDKKEGVSSVTPEQLGKFVAIMLRFPDLRSALSRNVNLLAELEAAAQATGVVAAFLERWLGHRGVKEVLLYGLDLGEEPFDRRIFSLKSFPVIKLLSVLANVPEKPNLNVAPGSMAGSAHGTSTATGDLTFSGSLDASKVQTSVPPENQAEQEPTTESPDEVPESIENAQTDDDREEGWQRVQAVLSPLSTDFQTAYREAMRILHRDGAASERFVLKNLQQQKLAMNWSGIFPQMQKTTNLVQQVPGQSDRIILVDKEWQIRPALQAAVASYLRRYDRSRPA
jgi:KAP-like P-loop domain-containing protein